MYNRQQRNSKMGSTVCLIPARGGSKRIPRKNITHFFDKPLIGWSISAALESAIFDDVVVSTDDQEIARISKNFGANVPFIRPEKESTDTAIDRDVRNHFLEWSAAKNQEIDILFYLYPTAAFFGGNNIRQCYSKLVASKASRIKTIVRQRFPILQSCTVDNEGFLHHEWEEFLHIRTQDMPTFYVDAGLCYGFNYSDLSRSGEIGYEVPEILAHDIDEPEDLKLAEKSFLYLKNEGWNPGDDPY